MQVHSAADLANNNEIKKIAISQPSAVPVGVYSKEYLVKLGLWDKVEKKVVPTENVRASLAAVESGNVQAGFVYKTDMLISDKVKSALEIPASEGPKISYPIAALKQARDLEAAKKLVEYLRSEAALKVFQKIRFQGGGVIHPKCNGADFQALPQKWDDAEKDIAQTPLSTNNSQPSQDLP